MWLLFGQLLGKILLLFIPSSGHTVHYRLMITYFLFRSNPTLSNWGTATPTVILSLTVSVVFTNLTFQGLEI